MTFSQATASSLGLANAPPAAHDAVLRALAPVVTALSRLWLEGAADGRYVHGAREPCELSNFQAVSGRCPSRIAR